MVSFIIFSRIGLSFPGIFDACFDQLVKSFNPKFDIIKSMVDFFDQHFNLRDCKSVIDHRNTPILILCSLFSFQARLDICLEHGGKGDQKDIGIKILLHGFHLKNGLAARLSLFYLKNG
jgi:hypothetical protein